MDCEGLVEVWIPQDGVAGEGLLEGLELHLLTQSGCSFLVRSVRGRVEKRS